MIVYRGVLKSCNYHCSYCPFSKHRVSMRELERDKEQWFCFVQSLLEQAGSLSIRGLMVVPYGEALIHPWYWEGLAKLSASVFFDAVGAQTNFSFDLEEALDRFTRAGGQIRKLRLWATFHPEMVSAEEFGEKCKKAANAGVSLCGGAVGVPENIPFLKQLRAILPKEVYLWINKMDGLKRPYSEKEIQAFSAIDPFFHRELRFISANPQRCTGRLFAEGDGKLRPCNLGSLMPERWYQEGETGNFQGIQAEVVPKCSQKICSCYLAYGGRRDWMNDLLFGPFPLFRIPRRPKAVFLDIEGTLIPKGSSQIPKEVAEDLAALAADGKTALFFATTIPYQEALKRCKEIWHLFQGGIFAGGAHLYLNGLLKKERVYSFDGDRLLPFLEEKKEQDHFRILIYREREKIYKISLVRPARKIWEKEEIQKLRHFVTEKNQAGKVRVFAEGYCLQIISDEANKANGVRQICKWLDIEPKDTAAAGDGEEDLEMLALCRRKTEMTQQQIGH